MKHDKLTPFAYSFQDSIGRGKDNIVCPITDELVVKWNHDTKEILSSDEHFLRLLYKKRKYEMLKFFLQGFIPDTFFVLGNKQDGKKVKIKEYCIQERVPQVSISSLTDEQKNDHRLLKNIHLLILKLQNLYRLIQKVNSVVDENGRLDAKLDLGGLSKYADSHKEDQNDKNFDGNIVNYDFMSSPNLLVNQETMDIYCIDFDQGVWNNEKEFSHTMLLSMTRQNQEAMSIINKK